MAHMLGNDVGEVVAVDEDQVQRIDEPANGPPIGIEQTRKVIDGIATEMLTAEADQSFAIETILPKLRSLGEQLRTLVDSERVGGETERLLQAQDDVNWFEQVTEVLESMASEMTYPELRDSIQNLLRDAQRALDHIDMLQ